MSKGIKLDHISLSKKEARRIAVAAQLLNNPAADQKDREGLIDIIDHLGYVQIDTISVIERAHHHVFWTRQGNYTAEMLHDLQTVDRAVFEYWGHAMSYMPMKDFRYTLPRMENLKNPQTYWMKMQYEKSKHLLDPVLERIRNEGPLGSKDFKSEKKQGGTWWDWKPAKLALELLFWRGELMITERQNFQKIYDLTERVLPSELDTSFPSPEEVSRFLVLRALKAMGLAAEKEIMKYMQPGTVRDADLQVAGRDQIKQTISDLMEEGVITPAFIEGDPKKINFMLTNPAEIGPKPAPFPQVRILSPFDNLVIQRERLVRLFDFDYTIECYVPEAKRKWGYFVLPVLYGDTLIGRLDTKADRKTDTLTVNTLYFEPGFTPEEAFVDAFSATLASFTRFNGCEKFVIETSPTAKIKQVLEKRVKKYLS